MTERAALIVTVRVPSAFVVPSPLHPLKVEPAAGLAVSVTLVPWSKLAEQVEPQLMPAGLLVTVPLPAPVLLTVSGYVIRLKVAVTFRASVMLTV